MGTAIALTFVTLAEASIGVFVKLVGDAIPVYTLNFYRVLFATVFLAATVPLFSNGTLKFTRRNLRDILIIGVLIAAQISFFNLAMTLAPIANVVIFWSVAPFFVFIFSTLFLDEKPRPVHIFIFILAIIGVVIAEPVSFSGDMLSGHSLGNLIALADGAIYAAMVTYIRNEGKTEHSVDIFWFMVAATVYLSPALLIFGPGDILAFNSAPALSFAAPAIVWAICLGVISTGLAFLFISVVLKTINANIYSLVDIIVSPLVAAIFGFLIFYEVPTLNTVLGGVILLLSGFWLTIVMGKNKKQAQKAVPGK